MTKSIPQGSAGTPVGGIRVNYTFIFAHPLGVPIRLKLSVPDLNMMYVVRRSGEAFISSTVHLKLEGKSEGNVHAKFGI